MEELYKAQLKNDINFQRIKLHSFQNLSLGFILKIFLKFRNFSLDFLVNYILIKKERLYLRNTKLCFIAAYWQIT